MQFRCSEARYDTDKSIIALRFQDLSCIYPIGWGKRDWGVKMANIKDIALASGVSVATVSRALAKPGLVRHETLQKVNAAIAELGYIPNAMASSLRRKRTDTLLIVIPNLHNPFYSGVVEGVERVADREGLRVLLGETRGEQQRLEIYADMLAKKQADGMILLGEMVPTGMDDAAHLKNRIVMACEYPANVRLPRVRIDNQQAAHEAVAYLATLGHRRIATITGPIDGALGRKRHKGYLSALKEKGLDVDERLVCNGTFEFGSGVIAMQRLLCIPDRPTAVFCANDEMAIGAMQALWQAGLQVPADCSVIGFDDIRFAAYASPPLTTVAQPTEEIGMAAMELLLRCLNDEEGMDQEETLPHRLIVRSSTAVLR